VDRAGEGHFGPASARGTRPSQAGARRPGGRGRLVHGPGRLWPWPRRPGPWEWRKARGGVMGVRPVRDGREDSLRRCRERDSSSRVPHGSRERGRPPLRIGIRRSTALLRGPGKVTGGAQKLPEARRSRHLRHRLTTQPFAVERKSLYAGLSHHSNGDKRPHRPGTLTEVRLRAVPVPPRPRKSDFVTSLRLLPHEPPRPGRLDGGHSLPGPPSRRPGRTSDGRAASEPRPRSA
jgi:hypothetical protein